MRNRSRPIIALVALVLTFGLVACGDDDDSTDNGTAATDAAPTTHSVEVDDNFFNPEEIEISVGDTVNWEWVGNEPHNVVGDDFESDLQQEGSFEHTFDEAGTYQYVCTIHPGMEGVVEVS